MEDGSDLHIGWTNKIHLSVTHNRSIKNLDENLTCFRNNIDLTQKKLKNICIAYCLQILDICDIYNIETLSSAIWRKENNMTVAHFTGNFLHTYHYLPVQKSDPPIR